MNRDAQRLVVRVPPVVGGVPREMTVILSRLGSLHGSPVPESGAEPGSSWRASGVHFAVAIVDDQPVTRTGMEKVLSEDPNLTVVASVASVEDLLRESEPSARYDAAILALPSPNASAISMITTMATMAHTVVTSTWEQPTMVLDAIRSGARGCVTRHSDRDVVLTAVRVVADGGFYLCGRLVDKFHAELLRPPREETGALAPREIETVRWIALGLTQSQIATRMGLSQATVNTYAKRIRSKLKVNNKAELTRVAIELGYLNDERQHVAA
jgi:DNA-binding NarL/FixJ family response regulator